MGDDLAGAQEWQHRPRQLPRRADESADHRDHAGQESRLDVSGSQTLRQFDAVLAGAGRWGWVAAMTSKSTALFPGTESLQVPSAATREYQNKFEIRGK